VSVEVYLRVVVADDHIATEVNFTTMPRHGYMQGEAPVGPAPDVLRQGLRIAERVADFADSVRTT